MSFYCATRMDRTLIQLVEQLQIEVESLCIRGIQAVSGEQINWFTNTRQSFEEMGAEFLASKISDLLNKIDNNAAAAPGSLLDLLTSVRVFERVVTLRCAEAALTWYINPQRDIE